MIRTIRVTALAVIIQAIVLFHPGQAAAQLSPEQTVNPVTGEMGFALPLATVKGVNGHDFPINLNYKAGILYSQESSPVGMGFSIGAGSIVRKQVDVPDDNVEGDYVETGNPTICTDNNDHVLLTVLIMSLTIILVCVSMALGQLGFVGFILSTALSQGWQVASSEILKSAYASPQSYNAGGRHTPVYDYANGQGIGFFKGGDKYDHSDVYIVSTPYISGRLVWLGSAALGRFVFQETGGSGAQGSSTIDVKYDIDNQVFTLHLADGTKLLFGTNQAVQMSQFGAAFGYSQQVGSNTCDATRNVYQNRRFINQWFLTRVLFSDFKDGSTPVDNDPLNSVQSNEGSWVCFKHKMQVNETGVTPIPGEVQLRRIPSAEDLGTCADMWPAMNTTNNIYQEIVLDSIVTPNQKAAFNYSNNRQDDLWFRNSDILLTGGTGSFFSQFKSKTSYLIPINRPVLNSIQVISKDKWQLRKIGFNQDYSLRIMSLHSFSKDNQGHIKFLDNNPNAGCLTLKSLDIMDKTSLKTQQASFNYNYNPQSFAAHNFQYFDAWNFAGNLCQSGQNCPAAGLRIINYSIEEKDVWGYYCPNMNAAWNKPNDTNNFNAPGMYSRSVDPVSKVPYASAWSLTDVHLPFGMTISWVYESNRYDAANQCAVSSVSGSPKYTGGIRVNKVVANNGLGKTENWTYFYRDMITPGDFLASIENEPGNKSSGHATVEPYNYLFESDLRPDKAKGGSYTPSQILYETVEVAKNVDVTNKRAPNGYTVYNFITSKENPNGGTYGDVDYSWERGLLGSISQYNSGNKLVSKRTNEYAFIPQGCQGSYPYFEYSFIQGAYYGAKATIGWPKLTKTTTFQNGVSQEKCFVYGDADTSSIDCGRSTCDSTKCISIYSTTFASFSGEASLTKFAATKGIPGTDARKPCIFYVAPTSEWGQVKIRAMYNIDSTNSATPNAQWSSILTLKNDFVTQSNVMTGMDIVDLQNDGKRDDMIIQWVNQDETVALTVLKNITINSSTIIVPGSTPSSSTNKPSFHGIPGENYSWAGKFSNIKFSCIGNINLNIPGSANNPAGLDLILVTSDYFFVCCQVDFISGSLGFSNYACRAWQFCANGFSADEKNGCFYDLDGDGILNDLVTCGPNGIWVRTKITSSSSTQIPKYAGTGDPTAPLSLPSANDRSGVSQTGTCLGITMTGNGAQKYFPYLGIVNGTQRSFLVFYKRIKIPGDLDGQANQIIETNSNGTKRITTPIPAYWRYPNMRISDCSAPKLLSQVCQTTVYEKAAGNTSAPAPGEARSSQVTRWNSAPRGSCTDLWRPCSTYVWKTPMTPTGAASTPLPTFNFATPSSNDATWKFTGGITRYNSYGQVNEATDALNVPSTTVYGTSGSLPVGSISPAKFDECGVFTCDYDLNQNGNFDQQNGWGKGSVHSGSNGVVEITAVESHFGQKTLHIREAYSAVKTLKIDRTKDYTYSCWVKPTNGKPFVRMGIELHAANGSTVGTWIGAWDLVRNNLYPDCWSLLELKLKASELSSHLAAGRSVSEIAYYVIWIGRIAADPAGQTDFYVDDIRFYPSKSLVTTTYYDTLWQQPILSVDADNNPGKLVKYDEFGRPNKWYKVDPGQSRNVTGADKLLQSKRYFITGSTN